MTMRDRLFFEELAAKEKKKVSAPRMTFRRRWAAVNEHREALGRRKLAEGSRTALARHEHLIELYAPYAADPWATYDNVTRNEMEALLKQQRAKDKEAKR